MSTRFPTLAESAAPPENGERKDALDRLTGDIETVLRRCETLEAENRQLHQRLQSMTEAHNQLVDKIKDMRNGRSA